MVIMMSKGKPCPHFRIILLIFMTAVAVFSIEVRNDTLEKEKPTFRV